MVLAAVSGCGDDASGTADAAVDAGNGMGNGEARRMVLASIASEAVMPTYRAFETEADALADATAGWAAAPDSTETRQAAREAWASAMEVWQQAELMQFGPAGASDMVQGGENLRDEIYSWPLTNTCRIDQETANEGFADADAFAGTSVNVRGLDALEYLLFREDLSNTCAPNSSINAEGTWAALAEEEIVARRASYAAAAAADIRARAETLVDAWDPESGNFSAELATAGDGSSVYESSQQALNEVSNAMFYLDKEAKDMKLGEPAGLVPCRDLVCAEEVESPWANRSKAHLVSNLEGFRALFLGGPSAEEGTGFDDLLTELGSGDFASSMAANVDDAISRTQSLEPSLAEALSSDSASVTDTFMAIKSVTDDLKMQFVTLLDLETPQRAEGDND
jgi:predicted lipoprotein